MLGSEPTQASVSFYAEARQILTLNGVRVGSAGKILTASLQGRKMIMRILLLTLARLFHSLFIVCMLSCARCSYLGCVQRVCSFYCPALCFLRLLNIPDRLLRSMSASFNAASFLKCIENLEHVKQPSMRSIIILNYENPA